MIRLYGETCLILAWCFALLQCAVPLLGYARRNPYLLAFARPSAVGQFFCILSAYGLLTLAFALNDFSIAYVGANSHPTLPLLYQLSAVWGAHEGSILLWILMLNIWTLAFSRLTAGLPSEFTALILANLGLISFFFLCFLLLTSDPFVASAADTFQTGSDLNPLLQDPGFISHPPMLYAGYVGFSVAFAITQAALIRGKLDQQWAKITRIFALAAWAFLTLGITLGSLWAYRVLGWGGFWFWDPVENASLLPWLAGLALIHILVLAEHRELAKGWAALLTVITFALSLLGTFLVRSGVLISAHTFANDPARGVFLLLLLTLLLTASLAIYVLRLATSTSAKTRPDSFSVTRRPDSFSVTRKPDSLSVTRQFAFSWISREMGLLVNSVLIIAAMLTILLGTLYPLILDSLRLDAISIGAPYFNMTMLPLTLIVLFLMGAVTFCPWGKLSMSLLWSRMVKRLCVVSIISPILLWSLTGELNLLNTLTLCLCFWVLWSIVGGFRSHIGMSLAHAGFAVLVMGILLSSILAQEREVRIQEGGWVKLAPYQFVLERIEASKGANYHGIRAIFAVLKNNRHITYLYPEKRIYPVRDMIMTKADIHPGIFRDLYLALGEPLDQKSWSLHVYYKPFIRWIWLGGMLMMIGGLLTVLRALGKTYLTGY